MTDDALSALARETALAIGHNMGWNQREDTSSFAMAEHYIESALSQQAERIAAVKVEVIGHPDKPVAAPCCVSGCQYAEYSGVFDLAVRQAERIRELEGALRRVIEHARPAFPRTPYREALDAATMLLSVDSLASGVSGEIPAQKCVKCGEPFTHGQAYFAAVHVSCVRSPYE